MAGRDKPAFAWTVTLLRNGEGNAYCLPGGKIVVYTGILPLTRSDAGLATVLGHEVAHATAEHVAERLERQHLTRVAAAIIAGRVAVTPGQYARVVALLGVGGEAASLPFSRSQESEADHTAWSTWPGRDTTRVRRWPSGSGWRGHRRQGAARVRQRSPQRPASDRAGPRMVARGRTGLQAGSVELTLDRGTPARHDAQAPRESITPRPLRLEAGATSVSPRCSLCLDAATRTRAA